MWKRAFVALLSLNLFILVVFTLWWSSLPKASQIDRNVNILASQQHPATIQLAIGQDAINSYLEYAVSEQTDVARVLAYARVQFDTTWDIQVGIRLRDRVVPCDITFTPSIRDGNLYLHMQQALMGEIPVPPSALFFVFRHLPWPDWITVDADHLNLNLLFSQRPQHPYGLKMLGYSATTKLLSLEVTIVPKSLLQQ